MALLRFLGRLLLLPVRLALAALGVTFRVGVKAGTVPAKVSLRSVRLVGVRGWLFFLLGLAAGLLLAPGPGHQLRAKLRGLLAPSGMSDQELEAKITFELAHAPRTWHLPQPAVRVQSGTVTLAGAVNDDAARVELARVAGAIPGVVSVLNHLSVEGAGGAPDAAAD